MLAHSVWPGASFGWSVARWNRRAMYFVYSEMTKQEPGFAWGEIFEKEPAGSAASAPWARQELSASLFRDVRQSVAGLVEVSFGDGSAQEGHGWGR